MGIMYPGAGLGANTFNGAQTITNGGAGTSTFNYSTSAIGVVNEMVLHASAANLNVLTLQHDNSTSFSAANFRTRFNREKGALGVANDKTTSLANLNYWEAWSGYSFSQTPPATADSVTISGTTMTVAGNITGSFEPGVGIVGAGVTAATYIVTQLTGSAGGAGTYTLNQSMTVASPIMVVATAVSPIMDIHQTGWNPFLAGGTSTASSVTGTTATIGGTVTGYFMPGQKLSGTGITSNSYILAQLTGTPNGAGTYSLSQSSAATGTIAISALGAHTLESRMTFDPYTGTTKLGAWGLHSTAAWTWDKDGNATAIGNLVLSAGSLTLSAGNIALTTGNLTVSVGNTNVQTLAVAANLNFANGSILNWGSGRGAIRAPADGSFRFSNQANTGWTSLLFATGASTNVGIYNGTGTPEAAVTAAIGSIYQRLDGGAATSLYVKESGTGNTGWVAK